LINASDSPHVVVSATARALLERYVSWDAAELQNLGWISFSLSSILKNPPMFKTCSAATSSPDSDHDCLQVGTMPLQLDADNDTQWLAVVTLPVSAFHKQVQETIRAVDNDIFDVNHNTRWHIHEAGLVGLGVLVTVVAISACLGFGLGCLVSHPLRHLSTLMEELGGLNFGRESGKLGEALLEDSSGIRDVAKLQNAFCSLSRGTNAFSRFIPETVVRHIVRGDKRATRLHVSRREVTIMFSNIQDSACLSEKLSQRDLLFVLTRFFSVMTRIVELFDGVVGEIMTEPPG